MSISLIASVDLNFGLGYENKLLVHLSDDLKRFKELTLGTYTVMGRKSYESVINITGSSLPDRENIIITRNPKYVPFKPEDSVYVSVSEFLQHYYDYTECDTNVMICGGGEIYKEFLPHADKIFLTMIHTKFNEVDTWFPNFNTNSEWKVTQQEYHSKDDKHQYPFTYITYERVSKTSSQAFLDIRNKIQSAMKKQNVKYEDILNNIDSEKVVQINTVNGKVIIDSKDSLQRKWFEEFKK